MSVVSLHLHPEDLFDKESAGTLTAQERERLDAHVASCAECRLERRMRADFADEVGDTGHIALHDDAVMTALLMGRVAPSPASVVDPVVGTPDPSPRATGHATNDTAPVDVARVGSTRPRRVSRRASAVLLGAAAAFVASAAAAAVSPTARTILRESVSVSSSRTSPSAVSRVTAP
ncbi:MAG: zf-HC2 domain-containing protein [Polyangiaceae bacterium]